MADNTLLNAGTGGDTVRDLARQSGTVKTQVVQLDLGGPTANAEVLITAGQQAMAASVPVVIASNQTAIPVTQATLTKGTQGAQGVSTQDLKDSGRNVSTLFMAAPVVTTATETLQSLTGYKSGAAVTATTTPAVVTTGKTYRITRIVITYVAIATAGTARVNLRANLSGVGAVGSPLVDSWDVGAPAATAGVAQTISIDQPDGLEFAAGTGLVVTAQGFGATGTAAAVGYVKVSISGFEY